MKHVPTITTDGRAKCSCRAWIPPAIQPNETIGAYTTRAYGVHRAHVASFEGDASAQTNLFTEPAPAPDPARFALAVDPAFAIAESVLKLLQSEAL